MSFKYKTGENVELEVAGVTGLFEVVRHMPQEDRTSDHNYRIRSMRDGYERVAKETDLSPQNKQSVYAPAPTSRNGHRI
jgi:hypothetical protein